MVLVTPAARNTPRMKQVGGRMINSKHFHGITLYSKLSVFSIHFSEGEFRNFGAAAEKSNGTSEGSRNERA